MITSLRTARPIFTYIRKLAVLMRGAQPIISFAQPYSHYSKVTGQPLQRWEILMSLTSSNNWASTAQSQGGARRNQRLLPEFWTAVERYLLCSNREVTERRLRSGRVVFWGIFDSGRQVTRRLPQGTVLMPRRSDRHYPNRCAEWCHRAGTVGCLCGIRRYLSGSVWPAINLFSPSKHA